MLEQRDFYQVLSRKRKNPPQGGAERNIGTVQASTQDTFRISPITEKVWEVTRNKDL